MNKFKKILLLIVLITTTIFFYKSYNNVKLSENLLEAIIEFGIDDNENGKISKTELSDVVELNLMPHEISEINNLKYAKNYN